MPPQHEVSSSSLLEIFCDNAMGVQASCLPVLECGDDVWTYSELDIVSSGIAHDLKKQYGRFPKVAVVSENHPYVFAVMLAVWKLSGIFIPIDVHVPSELLSGMLAIAAPTFLLLPESDDVNRRVATDMNIPVHFFSAGEGTIPRLTQKYPAVSRGLHFPLPHTDHTCLYLFTSSASSTSNLKCVPLTHRFVLSNCRSKLAWWYRNLPAGQSLEGSRVLGWAPWSHVLAYMQDIGTVAFLNAGCYVLASVPSTYGSGSKDATQKRDPTSLVVSCLLQKHVVAFACVPFILSEIKALCENQESFALGGLRVDVGDLLKALRHLKMLECGGAMLGLDVIEWATENGLRIKVGVGMTETAGSIFAGPAEASRSGFSSADRLLADGKFSLLGQDGEEVFEEGELVVKSKLLPQGYIRRVDGAFSVDAHGCVTFKTGDVYHRTSEGLYSWVGRKTDFIQMSSGETLDPRQIENALRSHPMIANACVIGNNFLSGAATTVCAILQIEPALGLTTNATLEIANIIAPINKSLPPTLRIPWTHVRILQPPQTIPVTRKGDVFRKKIEAEFGSLFSSTKDAEALISPKPQRSPEEIRMSVQTTVTEITGVTEDELLVTFSFAELGLTSFMATAIANALNDKFPELQYPVNICYVHVDLASLTEATILKLNGVKAAAESSPSNSTPLSSVKDDDVVVVGKAFRLPGSLNSSKKLWETLMSKDDSIIADIPPDRWDHPSFYPHDINFNKAGLVDLAHYDHNFFGLTASEAFFVSPTMRLALEVSFEALENANIPLSSVKGTNTSVYVAVKDDGFETLLNAEQGYDAYTRFYGTGRAPSTTSGRISYLLDVHGPSITVDTACSGGIVCMDQAISYLKSGSGETAIVCSSNVHCWPGSFRFLTAQGMVSPNGRCAVFSADANGYVPSEGAVALILKTRSAAERDGDHILATVLATEISHNGRSQGLVAPNIKAQAQLHRSLLKKAALSPVDINFIEAHGTGTRLGDLCEIQGVNEAYTSSQPRISGPLVVSASKSVIGHTEPSAGLTGALTALLIFENGVIPGLNHLNDNDDNVNPALDCSAVPLLITSQPTPLPQQSGPYRAAVMSYGFAGTLAGAILEAPTAVPKKKVQSPTRRMLFVVSAKTQLALDAYLVEYSSFLKNSSPDDFSDICFTTCVGREHYKYRFCCSAKDMADLIRQVDHRLSSRTPNKLKSGSVSFVFSGQGTQFPGMAAQLARQYPGFRSIVEKAATQASTLSGHFINALLLEEGSADASSENRSEVDQVCIFVYQYSVLQWLRTLGVEPKLVFGHSLGEITASVAAGAMSFEIALDLVVTRSRLLRPGSKPAGMAAIAGSPMAVRTIIDELKLTESLTISVYNGPSGTVVSGWSSAIDEIIAASKARGLKASRLKVDQGFHSPCVDNAVPGLTEWSQKNAISYQPLRIPLLSTLTGGMVPRGKTFFPQHWVKHAREPVRFSTAAQVIEKDTSIGVVVDLGPQPVAWSLLQANAVTRASTVALFAKAGHDQETAFLSGLAELVQNHNVTPNFAALYESSENSLQKTDIPTYPFQRVRRYPTYLPSRHLFPGSLNTLTPATSPPSSVSGGELEPTKKDGGLDVPEGDLRTQLVLCLKGILETEELDLSETLNSHGVDSIMFGQIRKRIGEGFNIDVPILYLSEVFSIQEMLTYLVGQSKDQDSNADSNGGAQDLRKDIIDCLKEVLEVPSNQDLDLSDTLNARGVDSIMFAQLRKRVGEGLGVDIPFIYLSDVFSMDEMITSLVGEKDTALVSEGNGVSTEANIRQQLVEHLKAVLEVPQNEELDLSDTLNARGVDSIMFAQLRKRVGDGLDLDIPAVYLSDAFSMEDMINFLVDKDRGD